MISKIFHWLMGYACMEYEGQKARFLNITVKSGLVLWKVRSKDEKTTAYIRASEYKKLRIIRRRCGGKLKCLKKRGLPFYLYRLSRRKGLVLGSILGICFYVFLSSFVWQVKINGLEKLTEAQVLNAAEANGVYIGANKSAFSPAQASIEIRAALNTISWLSVNTDGCRVQIELKEADKKPDILPYGVPSNIIASREGKIVNIEAEVGMQQVQIGDIVEKDQLLITGIYSEKPTPYVEKKVPHKSYALRARGSVTAETVHTFKVYADRVKRTETIIGEHTNAYLMFLGVKIPLGFHAADDRLQRIYEENKNLTLLGESLPAGIRTEKSVFYEMTERELDDDEIKQQALFLLREKQKTELNPTAKLIEEDLKYEYTDTGCILYAVSRFEEEIGLEQEALWNITNSDSNFYK